MRQAVDKVLLFKLYCRYVYRKNERYVIFTPPLVESLDRFLDDEIAASKEDTQMLYYVIDALVDHPGDYTDAERTEILSKAKLLAPSIVKQPSERKSASNAWIAILAASGVVVSAALIAILGHNKD